MIGPASGLKLKPCPFITRLVLFLHSPAVNESKCKEMRISFAKISPVLTPLIVNDKPLETVERAKSLGLIISSNLKWNDHVVELVKKVSSRLKRSHVAPSELNLFMSPVLDRFLNMRILYSIPHFHAI